MDQQYRLMLTVTDGFAMELLGVTEELRHGRRVLKKLQDMAPDLVDGYDRSTQRVQEGVWYSMQSIIDAINKACQFLDDVAYETPKYKGCKREKED